MEDDAGVRTARKVFEELQVDAEWSEWSGRGFTWWPHHLGQRIEAEPPEENDGFTLVRVNSEIDLFSGEEEDWRKLSPIFAAASTFASMSGYVWKDGVIRLRCNMWCTTRSRLGCR
jgi:hypothetical protein